MCSTEYTETEYFIHNFSVSLVWCISGNLTDVVLLPATLIALYTIPDWLNSFPLSPRSPPAPVFSSHGGDRSEGVHNYFLRGFPQVVTVHRLEHPSGSLDLLASGGEGLDWVITLPRYLRLAPGNNEGWLQISSCPATSLAHHQILALLLLLRITIS